MPWMAGSRKPERLAAMILWLSLIAQESYLQRFGSISLSSPLVSVHVRIRLPCASFDHLVGTGKQRRRNIEAECPGGLEIDHKLELDWRLDGKLARFHALENAISIRRRTPVLVDEIRTIRDQATEFS